jgi:hypothetical protein
MTLSGRTQTYASLLYLSVRPRLQVYNEVCVSDEMQDIKFLETSCS